MGPYVGELGARAALGLAPAGPRAVQPGAGTALCGRTADPLVGRGLSAAHAAASAHRRAERHADPRLAAERDGDVAD